MYVDSSQMVIQYPYVDIRIYIYVYKVKALLPVLYENKA